MALSTTPGSGWNQPRHEHRDEVHPLAALDLGGSRSPAGGRRLDDHRGNRGHARDVGARRLRCALRVPVQAPPAQRGYGGRRLHARHVRSRSRSERDLARVLQAGVCVALLVAVVVYARRQAEMRAFVLAMAAALACSPFSGCTTSRSCSCRCRSPVHVLARSGSCLLRCGGSAPERETARQRKPPSFSASRWRRSCSAVVPPCLRCRRGVVATPLLPRGPRRRRATMIWPP